MDVNHILLIYYAARSGNSLLMFWDNLLVPNISKELPLLVA